MFIDLSPLRVLAIATVSLCSVSAAQAQPIVITIDRPDAGQSSTSSVVLTGTITNSSGSPVTLVGASLDARTASGAGNAAVRLAPEFLARGSTIPVAGYSGPLVTLTWSTARNPAEELTVHMALAVNGFGQPILAQVVVPPCMSQLGWTETAFPAANARAGAAACWFGPQSDPPVAPRMLSFGGRFVGGTRTDELWSFNGQAWSPVSRQQTWPGVRAYSSMVWSQGENAAILFGGQGAAGPLNDTWRYDGSAWTNVTSPNGPFARLGAAMAYDSLRGQTLLFGGAFGAVFFDETWVRPDGGAWAPINSLGARDTQVIVTALDVSTVTPTGPKASPTNSNYMNMEGSGNGAFASYGVARFNVSAAKATFDETYGAGQWHVASVTLSLAESNTSFTLAGPLGVYFSSDSTTNITNTGGSPLRFSSSAVPGGNSRGADGLVREDAPLAAYTFPTTGPVNSGRIDQYPLIQTPGMASRLASGSSNSIVTLVFEAAGETTAATYAGTTHPSGYQGPQLAIQAASNSSQWPAARQFGAMAFDPIRGRAVLFGGFNGTTRLGDTWEWDGYSWSAKSIGGPAPRSSHAMWFDSDTGRVTLFGGLGASGASLNDTWQWFGDHWEPIGFATVPERSEVAAAFDPVLGRAYVVGGQAGGTYPGSFLTGFPVSLVDFDCDGTVDFFDYDAFVACFEGGTCPPGRTADFDSDGSVDFFDYDSFVVAFEAGC